MSPKSKFAKLVRIIVSRVMLVLMTIVFFLIIAEIMTRMFSSVRPSVKIRDTEVGSKYIPNFSGERYINESQQIVSLKFHKDGFRGSDRPHKKPAKICRIAILGDSQIAAIATHEQNTLVSQLENLLNDHHPSVQWEVFNFGISGASTAQELVLYRKLALKYDPDIVICAYFIGNDFSDNSSRLDTNPRIYMGIDENGDLHVKPFSITRKKLSIWLNYHSRFYIWQKYKINVLGKTFRNTEQLYRVHGGQLIFMNQDTEKLNDVWKLNEKIIHSFHQEVVHDERDFLFVVIPDSIQLYTDNWEAFVVKDKEAQQYLERDYPDQKLAEIAGKKNIDSLFLRQGLEKHIANRPHTVSEAQVLYDGQGHLNKLGNQLSAEFIYTHLLNNNTIAQLIERYGDRTVESP